MITINTLDKITIQLQKSICGLPKCASNVTIQLPHDLYGVEAFSFKNTYLQYIGEQLQDAFNDLGILGNIYCSLLNYNLTKNGCTQYILSIIKVASLYSPTTQKLYFFKYNGKIHLEKSPS
jgi:hypothetical protein